MKKAFLALLILVLLAGGAYYLFFLRPGGGVVLGQEALPTSPPAVSYAPLPAAGVEALGRLVPAEYAEVRFRASGVIEELMVAEGQVVKKGQPVARLRDDFDQLQLAVSQANLELMNAEKALTDLENSAPLLAAQAFYDMTQVQKEIEKIEKRRNAMEYPRATEEEIGDAYEAYVDAEEAFKQASEYFKADSDVYKGAKQQRDNTLSRYNWLISKYTSLDKQEAEAELLLYQKRYADLERKYKIYENGPDPEETAIAEARIAVARDQLAVAEAALATAREDLVLAAPFSGTVVRLDFETGQAVSTAQPLLLLADLTHWNIETEDLTELYVTEIREGDAAEITIDALPNETFLGTVTEIKTVGETRRGDITYTVVISLEKNDPRLRWNMTSPITIAAGVSDD